MVMVKTNGYLRKEINTDTKKKINIWEVVLVKLIKRAHFKHSWAQRPVLIRPRWFELYLVCLE